MPRRAEEKKPLDVKLSVVATVSLLAGAGAAAAAGFGEASVAAGLTSVFVVAAAMAAPQPATFRAGIASGLVASLALVLAHLAGSIPVVAGIAMAAVAFLTSVAIAGGPLAGAIGSIIGLSYFLPAVLTLTVGYSSGRTAELSLVGLAAGFAVVTVILLAQKSFGKRPRVEGQPATRESAKKSEGPGPLALIAEAIRHPSPERNYAIRRALLLGVGLWLYLATENHNVFWVLLTIFVVLKPDMEQTWTKAISRSSGTIAGALAVGLLAQVLPSQVVVGMAVASLLVTLAYYRRNYAVYAAGISFLVIALLGDQQGDFLNWAVLRAGDTILGATIAIAAVYFILPGKEQAGRPA
jgi:MFS family permease